MWPLVAHGLREAHLLAGFELVELGAGDAVAVEIYLAAIGGGDEAVVLLGMHSGDRSVRGLLVLLDVALALAGQILQLPAGRLEGVADRHIDVLVRTGCRGLATDRDVASAWNDQVDSDLVGVALVMPVLWPGNDHAHHGNALVQLLQLGGLCPYADLNGVGMADVLEGELKRGLHGGTSY